MKKLLFLIPLTLFAFVLFTGQKIDDNPRWSKPFTHLYPSSNFVALPILPDKNISFSNSPRYIYTPNGVLAVNPSVRVLPSTTYAQTELYLASNKANRNVLFGSSNNVNMSGPTINSGCFVSTNNGSTWGGYQVINSNNPNDQRGDPGPVVDKNMNFLFSHLTSTTNFGGVTGIGCNYSSNFGANWSNTFMVESNSDADKNLSNTDDSPISPYYGYSYTAWCVLTLPATSRFARTTNFGVSWETQTLATTTTSYYAQGHDIACGPNGEVYVVWNTEPISSPWNGLYIAVAKSVNGGASFTANQYAITINGARDNTSFGGWEIRVNDFPRIDVDKSGGPYNGWIYIVTLEKNHAPAGTDPDVVLYRSSNAGTSWMPGVRVNQDAINNGKYQYFPAVRVDDNGGVNIIYYDNRNFANADSATVMISRSLDGGSTFTDFEISDHHFKPKPANGMSGGYMGDYIGLAIGNNKVFGFWMDDKAGVDGFYNAWTGSFDLGPAIVHTPLGNTEQTSGTIPVNCTILPAGSPIDPTKTKLVYGKSGVYTDSLLMTNTSGNSWTANLTLSGTGTYKYYIRTADNLGRIVTAPAGAPGSFYSFTATPDIIPPVINHTQFGPTPKSYWPITVTANVTDNIGVDSVWVMWYKNTPAIIKEFKLLPAGSNNYSAAFNSINSDVNLGDVIYYKIMSNDISSNHNVASLPTSGYYSFGIINLQLCEGFNTATFPPTNWTITGTSPTYWSYNAVSGYGLGTGSARFNFYSLTSGSAQLTTLQFDPSGVGDSLKFVLADAYYSTTYIDTLKIESSINGGTNWTTIWTLWSQTNFTDPHSLSTVSQSAQFVPTSGQWKTMTYLLPTGTNKIRFNAISGYGNDMFIDSTCIKAAPPATLSFNLTALLSGNYNGATMVPKNVTVELHGATTPYNLVESKTVLLNASGVGNPQYTTAVNGTPYYIVLKFDNGLETWSATPQTFIGSTLSYNFTDLATKAYGSNMVYVTNKWCIISGDANQDGSVDALDRSACWNDRNLSGVYVTDLNGDGTVDALDRSIAWNNRNLSVQKPALAANPNQEVKQDKKLDKNNSKGTKDLKLDGTNAKKVKTK